MVDRHTKIKTTMYLDADQVEQLRALATRTRIPFAVLVRDAIDLVLARHEPKEPA